MSSLPTKGQVIAIVDDDPGFLKGLKRLLDACGFTTEVFASGEEFLDRDSTSDIACIVLDINLGGMSGIEVRRRLAGRGSTIPVIFITALDTAATRKEAMDAGYAAFLGKPFSGRALIDAIREALF